MLEQFINLSSVVSTLLLKDVNTPPMILASELNEIKELMSLLKPLEYVTRDISGQYYITAFRIIPVVNCLLLQISLFKLESPLCIKAQSSLLENINERFRDVEENDILSVCTILDPRFKGVHFRNSNALSTSLCRIRYLTEKNIQPVLASSQNDDFWHRHKQLVDSSNKSANIDDEVSLYMISH